MDVAEVEDGTAAQKLINRIDDREAIGIVSLVCFVFLHNLRSAMMVMIAVPLSIIPAFIAVYAFGFSLNLMSLMALSLVVGIIGAFLALALTMSTLNIFSIIGLIVLIGLVAKNAILLVDFANHISEQGMDTLVAISLHFKITPDYTTDANSRLIV